MSTRLRKNQRDLTGREWRTLVRAIRILHDPRTPAPTWLSFVHVHAEAMTPAGMPWGVHTMEMDGTAMVGTHFRPWHHRAGLICTVIRSAVMVGRHFLPWHRELLWRMENRMREIDPQITLPYWDWTVDRALPAALSRAADLAAWGVTRDAPFRAHRLPTRRQVAAVLETGVCPPNFHAFQTALEDIHNDVHDAIGGTMGESHSPADPLFWLHHAFVDKLWAHWQNQHPELAFDPADAAAQLQPPPLLTHTVTEMLSISALGYGYK